MTPPPPDSPPRFVCDAMLGGLSRWLRAAGYEAEYEYGIDDGDLVQWAQRIDGVLLSSDGPLFERAVLRDGHIDSLFVPRGLSKLEQLTYVLQTLHLPLRGSRCMACGGQLEEVPRHEAAGEAPPLAFRNCDRFWRCSRCCKLLWRGTHWQRIARRLAEAAAGSADAPPSEPPEPETPR